MSFKKSLFRLCLLIVGMGLSSIAHSQYSRADTLRGSLTPERSCYDVTFYDLRIAIDTIRRSIEGSNTIHFNVVTPFKTMQVDLFDNLKIDTILWRNQPLTYRREGNAVFIDFPQTLQPSNKTTESIYVGYSGVPHVAARPPWSGGFTWARDREGKLFVSSTCQTIGASIWWPNKDHQTEKPDSMRIRIAVPPTLVEVSNGRLRGKKTLENGLVEYDWFVSYPINNYCVALNVANFTHFTDTLGDLTLDYYVLPYNLAAAKKQFAQVKPMMNCYSTNFGEYPFKRDGYKLIETTHAGMEHQSAVAYGNGFTNGYGGRDWTGAGVSLWFDFIIIHESGHEWFGNAITSKDIADMWIHEGLTTYAEAVYVECQFGYDNYLKYINGHKRHVLNDKPIIAAYNVQRVGSSDMYFKGALLLHTIRSIVDNDQQWKRVLKGFYQTYKYKIIDNNDVVRYFNKATKMDLTNVFDQYLKYADLPVLTLKIENNQLFYRWKADVNGFDMPIKLQLGDAKPICIKPKTNQWQSMSIKKALKRGLTTKQILVMEQLYYVQVVWE